MEEVGQVVSVEGNIARIRFHRSKACRNCGICFQVSKQDMETEAINVAGAKKGEQVIIGLETETFLKAAFFLYIIPLIFLFVGILVGNFTSQYIIKDSNETLLSFVGGLIFLGFSYFFIRNREGKAKGTKKYEPRVLKIVRK